jgi:26S proteasome regulatory subunit N1
LAALKDYATIESSQNVDHFSSWGHEFVRSISGEIGQEYNDRVIHQNADPETDADFADLLAMVQHIVPFHIHHNAEAEAIDLLMELQRLKLLLTISDTSKDTKMVVDDNNYERICLYVVKASDYMADPDDFTVRRSLSHLFSSSASRVVAHSRGSFLSPGNVGNGL